MDAILCPLPPSGTCDPSPVIFCATQVRLLAHWHDRDWPLARHQLVVVIGALHGRVKEQLHVSGCLIQYDADCMDCDFCVWNKMQVAYGLCLSGTKILERELRTSCLKK